MTYTFLFLQLLSLFLTWLFSWGREISVIWMWFREGTEHEATAVASQAFAEIL